MENALDKYECVVGLEVHAQLQTSSKAYSSDPNEYDAAPNHNVSAITLGHPGTLPRFNSRTMEYALRLGIACKSDIREWNEFARKNYFYPDLPKGYQITQDTTPICTGGHIAIKPKGGAEKNIRLQRIHMEEDSGKSIHDQDPFNSLVDLNRAGVPLLEIVTEPDLRSADDAYAYLTEVRKLVRYLDVCDGNMEEGSMRCDANVSVRLKGSETFGRRVEVKNMNSMRNVRDAIEYEMKRQVELIENGETVVQETRGFDASRGITLSQRTKEAANDYRYFPEPDLQPIRIKQEMSEEVRKNLPPLPSELFDRYTKEMGLSEYDAGILTDSKPIALYFEALTQHTKNFKAAANWLMGEVKGYLNDRAMGIEDFPVAPQAIAEIIELIDTGKVSNAIAAQKIFPALTEAPDQSPKAIAESNNWIQESDDGTLKEYVQAALDKYPEKVAEYKGGKKSLVGMFMGEVMKMSRGKADPKKANQMVREMLENA